MSNTLAQHVIRSTVERVERIRQEIAELQEAEKEVFAEAKNQGLDVTVLKTVLKNRAEDPHARAERKAIEELYEEACR